jgi:RNA-binding motif X-linked protein 2
MQSVRQIERLNQTELDKVIPSNASWHTDYRDTAYLYIGGLPFELSEGDILTIFSQYGNPVHINLVRDKETGKSRGFCFLKYEDQRSCDLAVDNLSGAGVMGRVMSVDHTRYKKKEGEIEGIGDEEEEEADATDKEGDDRRKRRRTESASESEAERPLLKEEIELAKLLQEHDEDDPMKAYLVKEKREEVAEALKGLVKHKSKSRDKDRSRDDRKHRHRHSHHSRKNDEKEGDVRESRRDGYRSRRDGEDGHRSHRSHRSRREKSRSPGSGGEDERLSHKSRRDRSRTPGSDRDGRPNHKSRRGDSTSDHERPRRRREQDEGRKRSEDERAQSREPYRRRS